MLIFWLLVEAAKWSKKFFFSFAERRMPGVLYEKKNEAKCPIKYAEIGKPHVKTKHNTAGQQLIA